MKVLLINEVLGTTSTGKICAQIAEEMEDKGCEVQVAYGRWKDVPPKYQKFAHYIGSDLEVKLHVFQTRLFDTNGFGSKLATKKFLAWADDFKPDLLWLHNLHGYYINIEMLFAWIKKHSDLQIKWTLHDCWAFTGHCTHFAAVHCNQWKTKCSHCSQLRRYPSCYFKGNVRRNYERKRNAFTGVKNLTLITPSNWLANLVHDSFLNEYPVEVQYNVVDTRVFKPTSSDFRDRYELQNKIVILGVANVWDERKGLTDLYSLAQMLNDHYRVVIVGLNRKQIKKMPKNVIGIQRTDSPKELAAIYTAADVLVNPSREETFGMTPLEAEACGTPSIVYENTACAEVAQKSGNMIVPQNVQSIYKTLLNRWGKE